MNYENIRQRPKQFQVVTSLNVEEFDKLLPNFGKELDYILRYTTRGTIRKNVMSFPNTLPTVSIFLFFVLTYLKLNPLQEQHGASFDMSQPSVSKWIKVGLLAFNRTLKKLGHSPCRDGQNFSTWVSKYKEKQIKEGRLKIDEEKEGEHFIIDGVSTCIERPLSYEEQEDHYNGKDHDHVIKNTVISNEQSEILFLSYTHLGTTHDKKMADEDKIIFPNDSFLWKDTGYQGYSPEGVNCFQPYKKPKNGALTIWQKLENKAISSVRIVVEHAIGGMKRCRIIKDRIRLYKYEIRDMVMEICAALHNFRLRQRKGYQHHEIFNPVVS